jgi:hypothetical protein
MNFESVSSNLNSPLMNQFSKYSNTLGSWKDNVYKITQFVINHRVAVISSVALVAITATAVFVAKMLFDKFTLTRTHSHYLRESEKLQQYLNDNLFETTDLNSDIMQTSIKNFLERSGLDRELNLEIQTVKRGTILTINDSTLSDQEMVSFLKVALSPPLNITGIVLDSCSLITGEMFKSLDCSQLELITFEKCSSLTENNLRDIINKSGVLRLSLLGSSQISDQFLSEFESSHLLIKPDGTDNFKEQQTILFSELARFRYKVLAPIPVDDYKGTIDAVRTEFEMLKESYRIPTEALFKFGFANDWLFTDVMAGFVIPYFHEYCGELTSFDLSNTPITNLTVKTLAQNPYWKSLNLTGCQKLTSEVFKDLSKITSLEELQIGFSDLEDYDFAEIKNLSRLRLLNISLSKNVGDQGIREIKGLPIEELTISETQVTDAGFSHIITDLKDKLRLLNIRHCLAITDKSFQSIGQLKALRELDISGCSGIRNKGLSAIETLSLTKLSCRGCTQIEEEYFEKFFKIKELKEVDFWKCINLTDRSLSGGSSTDLRRVSIRGCSEVTDIGITSLTKWATQLIDLDIAQTEITESALNTITTSLRALKRLNISGCKKISKGQMSALKGMPKLNTLIFQSGLVTDQDLKMMGTDSSFPKLKYLDLSRCSLLTDDGFRASSLFSYQRIQHLLLKELAITDTTLHSIGTVPGAPLLSINLSGCGKITTEGVSKLLNQVNIERIILDHCTGLDDTLLEVLAKFPKLKKVSLIGCNLTPELVERFDLDKHIVEVRRS